ncbi:MAG: hypothetical protein AB1505_36395, partial [Candidatus Latescibacterota bacterium]
MNPASTRRKLNQTIGMIKVLLPCYVALWLWKGEREHIPKFVLTVPSQSEVNVGERFDVDVYVLGDLVQGQYKLELSANGKPVQAPLDRDPRRFNLSQKRYTVRGITSETVGAVGLLARLEHGSGVTFAADTVWVGELESGIQYVRLRQCCRDTITVPDDIVGHYDTWTLEDTLGRPLSS